MKRKGGGEELSKSVEKEREFWDSHSITESLNEFEFEDIKFVRKSPKVILSFRIEEDKARKLKELARKRHMPYSAFIRRIIDKALEKFREG